MPKNLIGQVLSNYKIVSKIGTGGMGVVYLGEHQAIGRKAAIKVLHPQYAAQPSIVERFFNEARAANQVKHPSIIEIYDFGQTEGLGAYLLMEFLEGESLEARLRRREKLPAAEVVGIVARVAAALTATHAKGIIHRDLKPDNIFLVPDSDHPSGERVKVLDFGIAKLDESGGSNTRTGTVLGTPTYMSPEQCHGAKNVDARSDIYALTVIAFKALCGRPPFVGEGFGQFMALHLTAEPPSIRSIEPSLSEELEAVLEQGLAKAPGDRYQTMEEFSEALWEALGTGGERMYITSPDSERTLTAPEAVPTRPEKRQRDAFDDSKTTLAKSSPANNSTLSYTASEVASASQVTPAPTRGRSWLAIAAAFSVIVVGGLAGAGYAYMDLLTERDADTDVVALAADDADTDVVALAADDAEDDDRTDRRDAEDDGEEDAEDDETAIADGDDASDPDDVASADDADTPSEGKSPKSPAKPAPPAKPAAAGKSVDKVLAGAKRKILACSMGTATKVHVAFEIDKSGRARRIVPKKPHTWSDEGTCIAEVLADLRFAAPAGGSDSVARTWSLKGKKKKPTKAPAVDGYAPTTR